MEITGHKSEIVWTSGDEGTDPIRPLARNVYLHALIEYPSVFKLRDDPINPAADWRNED